LSNQNCGWGERDQPDIKYLSPFGSRLIPFTANRPSRFRSKVCISVQWIRGMVGRERSRAGPARREVIVLRNDHR
jgi:hypothetical protein